MRIDELVSLFEQGRRRHLVLGDADAGVLVGLDLEGRIYAFLDGAVVNRVNPDAILQQSHAGQYHNPGGDGFWPAPEGSRVGYFYAAGEWRVPPGLSGARYRVLHQDDKSAAIAAEIDLINNDGVGVPVEFQRDISVESSPDAMTLTVGDSIRYLGKALLRQGDARIAPWTLSQFDTSAGMEVVFPGVPEACVFDLYDPADELRWGDGDRWHVKTEGGTRFQIGLAPQVDWIELHIPQRNPSTGSFDVAQDRSGQALRIRRCSDPAPDGWSYADIADRPPQEPPADAPTRYSIYNDATDFMEIEAAGPCLTEFAPGAAIGHRVVTEFRCGQP
ncbi:MAG TPA: DUF6786 family protein [Armatimonadota bacterium]|nr:DUF6786 family protein [Armatimonadota bacterium]